MRTKLIVATHNSHKTAEIRQIVGHSFGEVVDLNDYPEIPEAVEDGTTFEENSAIKAFAAGAELKQEDDDLYILADDSGLEVDALNGAPGVYSARYAGEDATDEENRRKLLEELSQAGVKGKARSGRFRCVLTLMKVGEKLAVFSGACEGIIANQDKGEGGFGYDPLFIPDGYCETFGQLPAETKNQLSHRANALALFAEWLAENE